jgi:hypothetical protein
MQLIYKDMLKSGAIAMVATRTILMATTPVGLGLMVGSMVGIGYSFYKKERDRANELLEYAIDLEEELILTKLGGFDDDK